MRKFILTVTILIVTMQLFAQGDTCYIFSYFKGNGEDGLHLAYSMDGYTWKALKGDSSFLSPGTPQDKIMRDPCIIRGADHIFHLVWTDKWFDRSIGYASSKDLIHWSEHVCLPVMQNEATAKNCWAPEITFDPSTSTYMIYWATIIPGTPGRGDSLAKPNNDDKHQRFYYVTTKDFKTFSQTKLLYDPGFSVIDATIVKDGKQFIMFFKNETQKPPEKNLHIAFSNHLTGPYGPPSPKITGDYWAEGPTVLRIADKWIVYFDKYMLHKYGAIVSTDLKTWTDISDSIKMPNGIRHGTVLKITKKELEALVNSSNRLTN